MPGRLMEENIGGRKGKALLEEEPRALVPELSFALVPTIVGAGVGVVLEPDWIL